MKATLKALPPLISRSDIYRQQKTPAANASAAGVFYYHLLFYAQLFFKPVLSVDKALNDEGHNIVSGCIDHGRRRIHQIAQSYGNGIGDGKLIGEEYGAEHKLAYTAAAGYAGHGNGGEHRNDYCKYGLAGAKVHAENAKEEGHLDDGGHCAAVHVHGGTHGYDHVADFLGYAAVLRGLHVRGYGGNRGTCAEGHRSGTENVLEHDFQALFAAAKVGIYGEENYAVGKTHEVIDEKSAAVVADKVRAICGHQICKEAEETDGCIIGDYLHHVHYAVIKVIEKLCHHGVRAAGHLNAEAEKYGENYERQHGSAGKKLIEVGLCEEVDYHIRKAKGLPYLALSYGIAAFDQGEYTHYYVHEYGGYGGGDKECKQRYTHYFAGALGAFHVCNSGSNGAKDHGYHNAEHEVYEYCAQRFKAGGLRPYPTCDAAANDGNHHADYEPVVFQKAFHLAPSFHRCVLHIF